MTHAPAGWPAEVPPPDAPGWERRAVGWLLDQCPPDYRGYDVVLRHPQALAYLAGHHLDAMLAATRAALASVRADLRDVVPPPALAETVEVLERELARLSGSRRAAGLLAEALAGVRRKPRL